MSYSRISKTSGYRCLSLIRSTEDQRVSDSADNTDTITDIYYSQAFTAIRLGSSATAYSKLETNSATFEFEFSLTNLFATFQK